ncbi:MAG: glycoside hydrolase family 2 TIM barrel-domain containing protein [Candidatus Omnitrophota bacterium]
MKRRMSMKAYIRILLGLLCIGQAGLCWAEDKTPPAENSFKLESVELKPVSGETAPAQGLDFGGQSSVDLTVKAWDALGKKDYAAARAYTQKCIDLYQEEALQQQNTLEDFPPAKKHNIYNSLNNTAACYFIRAEALMRQEKLEEARRDFQTVIDKFSFAQYWDPRGWFWKIAEKSQESIVKIDKLLRGETLEEVEAEVERPKSQLVLFDPGTEAIVDYEKYGTFENAGTKDYRYAIKDRAGLALACGEGVYPNTTSVRKDPAYLALKGSPRMEGTHWDFLYTEDMQANFYKWNMAAEPEGVRQFYIAFILERAGLWQQAVKAYYAIAVNFPGAVGWTYWHTPWYVGPVSLHKADYIMRHHPELGMELTSAFIKIENSFDNDVCNDVVICQPGKIIKSSAREAAPLKKDARSLKIIQRRGGRRTQLVQYANGHWQLLVNNLPFPVCGVTYSPTKIGQSPDEGTLGNWMTEDFNGNGRIDGPCDAWVDKNGNNTQDPDEPVIGDFQLMKDMGVNCIRVYHHPNKIDKKLLAELYDKYGIMTIVGDFLGAYTIGSGADWYTGTKYANPQDQKNMLASVEEMVNDMKKEPWVLFWMLGNENNYGVANDAKTNPQAYYSFVNQAAKLVHKLDPTRPVALCNGDALYLDIFAEQCPEIDIFGANAYRGREGFGNFWQDVADVAGRAALITEYGCGAYVQGNPAPIAAEEAQAEYHRGNWENIQSNMAGSGVGNALGGIVFEWLDEWWKAYEPARHDWKGQFHGPFPDGVMHEEWLGLCGQGDGSQSPFLRALRKGYYAYQEMWNK